MAEASEEISGPEDARQKAVAEPARERKEFDRVLILIFALMAAYVALFATLGLLKYANFRSSSIDNAIFNQVIWLMSRFKAPVSTIRGLNIFGDHMEPVLILLVPLYWLKFNVPGLIVVQTVALGLGALPIYLLARDKLESRPVAVGVAAAYLVYPALQHLTLGDFHPEALGLAFLLFAFLAIDRRRFGWFYFCCVGAALCKEDMILAVLVLGIVVYFLYDKRAGKIVAISSLACFIAAIAFLIPHFAPAGYQYSGRLGQFGKTPSEALKNMFFHPLRSFNILATRQNLSYVLDLLLPVAFLAVLAPAYLLPALPAFVINIISNFAPQHTIYFQQYTAAIIPFVFIATIFGLRKVRNWADGSFRQARVVGAVTLILLLCVLGTNVYYGPSPISVGWRTILYRSDAHVDSIRKGISLIPKGAPTSAQVYMLAHLSEREKLYMFPQPFADYVDKDYFDAIGEEGRNGVFPGMKQGKAMPRVDYIVLDTRGEVFPLPPDQYEKAVKRIRESGKYATIFDSRGVVVLKRADLR
jgi:uncharacterized membrane protein